MSTMDIILASASPYRRGLLLRLQNLSRCMGHLGALNPAARCEWSLSRLELHALERLHPHRSAITCDRQA